ncbi:MAG: hypothetical protein HS119_03045 [Flavobacteriales bacterium]|jgi:hypothetical protein|nr:hypothetical protein [Flavobacteriales bacterium]
MNVRFFLAAEVLNNGFNTWKKLFVLTPDNILYCEYLEFNEPTIINENFDYVSFKDSDYSWGRGKFQHLREIDYETARTEKLRNQSNWIDEYLTKKGII